MAKPMQLNEQLRKMALGDHTCLIYDSFEEQMAATIPFIKLGLERNEACVHICDESSFDRIYEAFAAGGIDIERAIDTGSLILITKRETYLASGDFDPERMIDFLHKSVKKAIDRGFSGFRVTGEMTWALGNECGCEKLVEYEALLNRFFPGNPVVAICQYDRSRFTPEIIRDVLRTHPIAILGDQVCTNLYYETPEMVLGQESLEGKVDWMIQQLKRFRSVEQNLQKSVKMRDDFLSIASHELRTPLTTLKLQNDMFMQDLRRETPVETEDWKDLLETNHRQIRHLISLVDDMLDISYISRGELSLQRSQVNLKSVIQNGISQQVQAMPNSVIEFDAEENVEGHWDLGRLEQVITNLLSNALKFGNHKPVYVSLQKDAGSAIISVQDQGIGIEPDKISRIFEKFERGARNISGLGLGLYIAKQIVEAHHGQISVASQPGQSTTFVVRLPLEAALNRTSLPEMETVTG